MSVEVIGLLFIAGMLFAIFLGLPVAIALGSVGLLSLFYVGGTSTLIVMAGGTAVYQLSHFGLLAIPLFMLMSSTIKASGIGANIVDLVIKWLHKVPGALHSAAVVSCAIFAAMSSSSVATAAAIGGFVLPEMKRRGHNLRLGIGAVAVGGTLGIMIPPSNYFILYGVLTETSITKLFMAGIVPGLMIVSAVIAFNTVLFRLRPDLNSTEVTEEAPGWAVKFQALRKAWTGLVLIVAVIGGIFLGVVTPTEAGGLGAVIALLIGVFVLKSVNRSRFVEILVEAVQTTSMMGFIIYGGLLLARASTMMNLSTYLIGVITESGLEPWQVLLLINLLLLVLGMFMDAAAITILTVPLLFPVIVSLGFDPIWFGVVVALNMELALVTPPVGLNIFVLKAVAGVSLREALLGTMPYAALLFVCLGILIAFPQIALWLPGMIQ
ncbi:TRAP transporter large permease [Oricola sp.]|uniref:TRAP transporter large permease n=1 Tax=Oricola sp. TaxID=1979950 RepID=UPI0025D9E4B3|nr:TRAP transporter large permease [Oricola sp.]MCI5075491.1 TRAP transporter large permease [Oricola sp.]